MTALHRLSRYWHTLRWLRPAQFYGRFWFLLFRPKPDFRPAPPLRKPSAAWRLCARAASITGPDSLRFLNVERRIVTAADWNRPDWPKLWLYNAHYFDDLVAGDAVTRTAWHSALMNRWLAENEPGRGNGWEPYPLSLRIVNWIKWSLTGNVLTEAARKSLAVQARYLRGRLEIHLSGNHLWANAKALVFAAAYFSGAEAESWRGKGLSLIRSELAEQILTDGGHYERSPMYHSIVLEDLIDLLQLAQRYPAVLPEADIANWALIVQRMLRWLRVMTHPDGAISFFNDAAFDIAPTFSELTVYASAHGIARDNTTLGDIESLPDSGYVRMQAGSSVLIADVGQIGPDHLPGHAHADTLSFELSLQGQRVLVNSGTSTYTAGPERQRQRGTAAHNTVVVDGLDSSEVWGCFRVARRARPFAVAWGASGGTLWLEAAHDGYRRLPGRVIHKRRWQLCKKNLVVEDALTGDFSSAEARFHILPCSDLIWDVQLGEGASLQGTWHPRFGESSACHVLSIKLVPDVCVTKFLWELCPGENSIPV